MTLVAGEVALSVALLVVAGLLLRTLIGLQSVETGFDARGVLTSRVTLPASGAESPALATAFFERTLAALEQDPAVVSASVASRVPAAGSRYNPNRSLTVEGLTAREGEGVFALDLAAAPRFGRATDRTTGGVVSAVRRDAELGRCRAGADHRDRAERHP